MLSWFKNIVGKKEIPIEVYLKRIVNPESNLYFPDKLIEEEFKKLVQISLERNDLQSLQKQGEIYVTFVKSGNFEEFSESFKAIKNEIWVNFIESFDELLIHYDKLETFWKTCETEHPKVINNEYYNFAEIEKIRENINMYREYLVKDKEVALEAVNSLDYQIMLDMMPILRIYNEVLQGSYYHSRAMADIFTIFFTEPEVLELFNSIFLLM